MADEPVEKQMVSQVMNEAMREAGIEADPEGRISVQDAVRLKHAINSDILYCGLNAREIEEKKKITAVEWAAARKWHKELAKMYGYRLRFYWYIVAGTLAA